MVFTFGLGEIVHYNRFFIIVNVLWTTWYVFAGIRAGVVQDVELVQGGGRKECFGVAFLLLKFSNKFPVNPEYMCRIFFSIMTRHIVLRCENITPHQSSPAGRH